MQREMLPNCHSEAERGGGIFATPDLVIPTQRNDAIDVRHKILTKLVIPSEARNLVSPKRRKFIPKEVACNP